MGGHCPWLTNNLILRAQVIRRISITTAGNEARSCDKSRRSRSIKGATKDPVNANVKINKVSLVLINDPARFRQIVVAAAVNVVAAIILHTAGCYKLVPEFMSAVRGRDGPEVNTSNGIRWQHRQFSIMALENPVHHPILQGTVPFSRGDPPGRHTVVVTEVAKPPKITRTARLRFLRDSE